MLLVEDKLGAAFQPDQGARYRARAEGYRAAGRATRTRIVLVAPAAYPARDAPGAAPFERHLALERLGEWLASPAAGARGPYLAGLVAHALRRQAPAGPGRAGERAPELGQLHALVRELLASRSPVEPGVTAISGVPNEWTYFAFPAQTGGAALRWRLRDLWAEVVLPATRDTRDALVERLEAALAAHPLPGAAVAKRGDTQAVVWAPTPEVDLAAPADERRAAVTESLAVADALAEWYRAAWLPRGATRPASGATST